MTLPESLDTNNPQQLTKAFAELLQQVTALTSQNTAFRKELQEQARQIIQLQQQPAPSQHSGDQHSPASPTSTPPKEPKAPLPEKFTGRQVDLRNFLASVKNTFNLQPSRFTSDRTKTAFIGSLLVGDPLTWYRSLLESESDLLDDYQDFLDDFKTNFGDPYIQENAKKQLLSLRQGNGRTASYAAKFRRIAADTGFNDETLMYHFERGLNIEIQKAIAVSNQEFLTLEELYQYSIKVDNRLAEFWQGPGTPRRFLEGSRPNIPSRFGEHVNNRPMETHTRHVDSGPTPMEIGAIVGGGRRKQLTPAQKEERYRKGLCFYCGEHGHLNHNCPHKRISTNQIAAATTPEEEPLNE